MSGPDARDLTREERERFGDLADRLARLPADAWEPPTPPPLAGPPAAARPRRGFVVRPGLALAASAALVAGGVGGGIAIERATDGGGGDTVRTLTLGPVGDAAPSAGGTVRVVDGRAPRLRIAVHGLQPTGPSRFYEVWLLNSPTDLVAVGGFGVGADGTGTFDAPLPVPTAGFKLVDLSLEPVDGNPAHSADSRLRATL